MECGGVDRKCRDKIFRSRIAETESEANEATRPTHKRLLIVYLVIPKRNSTTHSTFTLRPTLPRTLRRAAKNPGAENGGGVREVDGGGASLFIAVQFQLYWV